MAFRSVVLAAAMALVVPAQAREFRSSDVHPADYPTVEAVKQMGNALKEQSKGKHGVRVYANGALGNERDTLEQLKIGGLDMMR
ncbi:MAG TPA: TRAP transporter substrate-binding protein, partial [Beijerinckiaceae bacterium]|nr:TRAP transporter substrate-binding protein [Beijerinckiaceae bacterium]